MPAPEALVKAARLVVLARAAPNRLADLVEFQVVDTLTGTSPGPVMVLEGTAIAPSCGVSHDRHARSVPLRHAPLAI